MAATKPVGTSLYAWDDDKPRKVLLEQSGVACEGQHVVAWFPSQATLELEGPKGAQAADRVRGSLLNDSQRRDIVDRLDKGIAAAKRFIGNPDWTFRGDPRTYFYFPDANFISHAPGGNAIYIPYWRIREDKAPWLHEAMHLLLRNVEGADWILQDPDFQNTRMPLWLHEGMADALAMEVSSREGLVYYSPLVDAPPEQLGNFAGKQIWSSPNPTRLLEYIGGRGKMPELFGERRLDFAVGFYAGSASFVRFIAERHGYAPLIEAISSFNREHEELERLTGESLDSMKTQWLNVIGYGK